MDRWYYFGGGSTKFFMVEWREGEIQWVLESDSDVCSLPHLPRLRMLSCLTLRNVRRQGSSLRSLLPKPWPPGLSRTLHMWCLAIRCEWGWEPETGRDGGPLSPESFLVGPRQGVRMS